MGTAAQVLFKPQACNSRVLFFASVTCKDERGIFSITVTTCSDQHGLMPVLCRGTTSRPTVQTITARSSSLHCNSIYLRVKLTFRLHWWSLSVNQLARKCAAFTFHRDPMYPWQYIQLPGKCDIQTNRVGDCWLRILLMFYISQHKPWSVLPEEYSTAYQQDSEPQPDNCTGF